MCAANAAHRSMLFREASVLPAFVPCCAQHTKGSSGRDGVAQRHSSTA